MKIYLSIFVLISVFYLNQSSVYAQLEPSDLDFATLKQEFNSIKDYPVILTILGVNCPPCRTHRDDILNQIMGQCDNPNLRWLIIWFEDPGHPAVRADAVSQANLISDSRVKQWWYEEYQSSTPKNDSICYDFGLASWLTCSYPWDISMLFDGGIEWTGVNPPNATYCMSKTGCCNPYNAFNMSFQVKDIDACEKSFVNVISMMEEESIEIEVYPNPAKSDLSIIFNKDIGPFEITIQDIEGKIIFQRNSQYLSSSEFQLNINGWEKGLYIIHVETKSNVFTKRFLIVK